MSAKALPSIRTIEGWEGPMSKAQIISFDTADYKFAEVFGGIFMTKDLGSLHRSVIHRKMEKGESAELNYRDSVSLRDWLTQQVEKGSFYKLYRYFIRTVLVPFFHGKISYNQRPRFRVHLAGSPSVSSWHRDPDITGRFDQLAAWMSVVDCEGTNALWIESDYGKKDFRPVPLKYGEMLIFDSGLIHGSVANQSDVTRVGFDLRFAPKSNRVDADLGILSGRPPGFEKSNMEEV